MAGRRGRDTWLCAAVCGCVRRGGVRCEHRCEHRSYPQTLSASGRRLRAKRSVFTSATHMFIAAVQAVGVRQHLSIIS